jgi:hypothetical protein
MSGEGVRSGVLVLELVESAWSSGNGNVEISGKVVTASSNSRSAWTLSVFPTIEFLRAISSVILWRSTSKFEMRALAELSFELYKPTLAFKADKSLKMRCLVLSNLLTDDPITTLRRDPGLQDAILYFTIIIQSKTPTLSRRSSTHSHLILRWFQVPARGVILTPSLGSNL